MALGDFYYQATSADRVFISYRGRVVTILKGMKALAFLDEVEALDEPGEQYVMAVVTGQFKHGNERVAKERVRLRG